MAIFDPVEQRLCVRIVYDGCAGAGKTTNLQMLCGLLATQRKVEIYSPGEVDGRTLYFDWVQVMAGVVCGLPLMCQVITVPGQVVLTPRRRHLLESADVVVFVSDSSRLGIERSREAMRVLDEAREGRIPFVVQANKQDQADAIAGAELLMLLDRAGAPLVEAIASEGIGVVDTFVNAVRLVSREMRSLSETGTLSVEVRRAPGAAELLHTLQRQEVDPEWAAEMLLEEAQMALMLEQSRMSPEPTAVARDPSSTELRMPTADVPPGFIWPAHTGRSKLRALAENGALAVPVVIGPDGEVVQTVRGHILRTSRSRRYESREEAQQALVRSARERSQLGPLLVPETVLVAQTANDGSWWVWSISPQLPSLAEAISSQGRDSAAAVDAYVVAMVDALRTCLRHGFLLELGPAAFGREAGFVRYVGEVQSGTPSGDDLGKMLASAVEELSAIESMSSSSLVDAFGREIHRRFTQDELARAKAAIPSSPRDDRESPRAKLQDVLTRTSSAA